MFSYTLCKEKNGVERGREPQFNYNIYWTSKCIAMKGYGEHRIECKANLAENIKWEAVKDLVIRFRLLSLVFQAPRSGMSCSEI